MSIIQDQLNRNIQLKEVPRRIVSLVPSQTELLVDLGLRNKIAGVTKFCVHPENLRKEKKVVGGTKQVHLDRILSLKPDIILCNKEENTEEMVAELEKVAPVHVSDIMTIDDSLELIGQYGEMFGVTGKASEIIKKIQLEKAGFQEYIKDLPVRKVAYFIWKDPWMVAGGDTFINSLLEINRFENVFFNAISRYPEVDLKELKERNVELILLSTEPFPFKVKDKKALEKEVRMDGIHIVDGEYFSWYGSRLAAAFNYFRKLQAMLS